MSEGSAPAGRGASEVEIPDEELVVVGVAELLQAAKLTPPTVRASAITTAEVAFFLRTPGQLRTGNLGIPKQ
jgi:hypothetical protein